VASVGREVPDNGTRDILKTLKQPFGGKRRDSRHRRRESRKLLRKDPRRKKASSLLSKPKRGFLMRGKVKGKPADPMLERIYANWGKNANHLLPPMSPKSLPSKCHER